MTTLVGCPPRFQHVPLFYSSAGRDAVDLAEFAGLTLDPWQCDVLEGALGTTAAGRWAAMEVAVIVPRQNGKGGILEARQLFGLYLNPRDELQTHTAHRFDTCLDHFRRVRGLIEGNDELLAKVKRNGIKDSNGKESIELVDGHRLLFKARSKGSGRGFSGDVVYFDEAFWLLGLGDMIPSLSARVDPQIWYTSSAPLPRTESDILRSIIRRGRALCA
jgi:phage terminase large subunit-like protein